MDPAEIFISVVIPTYHRPELVGRAVESALAQTLREIEVIVVVDGRDPATCDLLARMVDDRLRVVLPEHHLGNAEARNRGVGEARGRYVAFLDDDDIWLPPKLTLQAATAQRSSCRLPIVACSLIARSETEDFVWPRRPPRPGEPMSEYLFCRRTPFMGEGLITTSAVMAPTELMRAVPFRALSRYVDVDWLLRASRMDGVGVEFVPGGDPLLIWHIARAWPRITDARNWEFSLAFARENRQLFTSRGYAAFLLHAASSDAASMGVSRAFLPLLQEAFRRGDPALVDLLSHLGNFMVPDRVRRRVAAGFSRLHRARSGPAHLQR
ncbi:MAG TPA: glycosyltransferase [Gemmatimonadales bacterium]|nr:glycosyltransferase [Gemmatimonadales bacterium]